MSKQRFVGRIIQLSAKSQKPLEDEILRDFAAAIGEDPDALVKTHREMIDVFSGKVVLGPVEKLKKSPRPTKD